VSGLAGFVAREPVHPELTEKLDAFRHVNRIPGMRMLEQHWVGPGCVLFNSQTGLLPHHSEIHAHDSLTGTHLLVEGEVLNAEELQEQVGITHSEEGKASSPLEGLIHLFLKSGPSFIGQFQGEFAVAVYEEKQRCLHLFTDHLSTKSIFYLVDREGFFFSSEKKSILAACASAVSLDPLGLLQIVAMHHNLHDRTTISETKRLTPASHLRFEFSAPLADLDFVQFALGLPLRLRVEQTLYQSMIWWMAPEIRSVPYANKLTPVRPRALFGPASKRIRNRGNRILEDLRNRIGANLSRRNDRLDAGFREHIESYITSRDFDTRVFDSRKIRTALDAHYRGEVDNFRLLAILATLSVGLPMFLTGRPKRCPPSAVRYLGYA